VQLVENYLRVDTLYRASLALVDYLKWQTTDLSRLIFQAESHGTPRGLLHQKCMYVSIRVESRVQL